MGVWSSQNEQMLRMKNTIYNEEEVLEFIKKFHYEIGIQFSNESMELFNKLKKTNENLKQND